MSKSHMIGIILRISGIFFLVTGAVYFLSLLYSIFSTALADYNIPDNYILAFFVHMLPRLAMIACAAVLIIISRKYSEEAENETEKSTLGQALINLSVGTLLTIQAAYSIFLLVANFFTSYMTMKSADMENVTHAIRGNIISNIPQMVLYVVMLGIGIFYLIKRRKAELPQESNESEQ